MMPVKKKRATRAKQVRASVTFPGNHYSELENIATAKKVSVAWVVREAIEQYITAQWPLLGKED